MKIREILKEDVTDQVARFYPEASKDDDRYYNLENVQYKEKNNLYYEDYFKDWYKSNITPIFTVPVTKAQPKFDNHPHVGRTQSAGYRGLQLALAAAGLPYNHDVQIYNPSAAALVASEVMNGARNNNGQ